MRIGFKNLKQNALLSYDETDRHKGTYKGSICVKNAFFNKNIVYKIS